MTDLLSQEQMQDHVLPDGWTTASLQELGEINPRFDKDELPEDLEVTFLPMKCVEEVSGKIDASNSRHVSEVRKGYTPFQEEDIVFAKITPCMENGKMAVARGLRNMIGFGSSEFHVVRLHESIPRDFFFYFLVRGDFRKDAERKMTGSAGQRRVPTTYIKEATVPLPPLNEQRRIVEKIEELFTKLDAGVSSLEQARAQLKSYRRSVLKAAVEGELSREWREAHRDELEPASELLDRILQERREKFADKKYKEPASPNTSDLPELPKRWEWATGSQLAAKIVDGTHHTPTYVQEGIAFISVKDIRQGRIHFNDCRYISEEEHQRLKQRCNPETGDVLITKSGTIGRTAVVDTDNEFSLFVSVALLKRASHELNSRFLKLSLEAYIQSINIQQVVKGGVIKNLHLEDLRIVPLRLAPTEEQEVIIQEVERRLSVVDKLEATVEANLKQAAGLRQSILKRAFSGELVPQDPDDEPASVLLERIWEERAATKQKARRPRKVRKDDGAQGRLI